MGLLTQLISQHHDTKTRELAYKMDGYKSILQDQRSPETEGGYTPEFKTDTLRKMFELMDGGGKKGGSGGAGGKGKSEEMFGVFQKLMGLDKSSGGNGGSGGSGMQAAAMGTGQPSQQPAQPAQQEQEVTGTDLRQEQFQLQEQPQQVAPQQGQSQAQVSNPPAGQTQVNPETLQRIKQIQAQRQQGQAGQSSQPQAGRPQPFMTEEQRQASMDQRQKAQVQGLVNRRCLVEPVPN